MATKRNSRTVTEQEDAVIAEALSILSSRIKSKPVSLTSPNQVKTYLICHFGLSEREVFSVLWTDVRNNLIEHEILFFGTLTHCAVYPREVVKSALKANAAGAILVHNHPSSGNPEPSDADQTLTAALKAALAYVDTRVLDHVIVAGTHTYSFAENGLM